MHYRIMCLGLSPGAGLPMDEGISMMLVTTMTMMMMTTTTMEIKITKKAMMMKTMSFMMPMMTVR